MRCKCGGKLETTDTRKPVVTGNGKRELQGHFAILGENWIKRRKRCVKCGESFTTYEMPADDMFNLKKVGIDESIEMLKKMKEDL